MGCVAEQCGAPQHPQGATVSVGIYVESGSKYEGAKPGKCVPGSTLRGSLSSFEADPFAVHPQEFRTSLSVWPSRGRKTARRSGSPARCVSGRCSGILLLGKGQETNRLFRTQAEVIGANLQCSASREQVRSC